MDEHIGPSTNTLAVSSFCQTRDVAYTIFNSSVRVIVSRGSNSNDLSGSFCIGIIADTLAVNTGPIMTFVGAGGAVVGDITLSGSTLSVNIAGQRAQFTTTVTGHQYFQLCSDGNTLTLYQRCGDPQSQPFGPTSLAGVTMIVFYGSPQSAFQVSIISRKTEVSVNTISSSSSSMSSFLHRAA